MAEETRYHGLRNEQGWIIRSDLTLTEAEEALQKRMHGANRGNSYWIEVEEDHLVARFVERDEPGSASYPGTNAIAKDGVWRSMRGTHSDKRKEYPNP